MYLLAIFNLQQPFGNTVMDARITAIGDKLKIGDIFNKIKFNNAVFTGKNKPAVINRSAQNSRYNLGVKQWLMYEHLESNLAIESVRQEACTKVYARCMELYDECFTMAEDSSTMANNLPSLKAAFTACLLYTSPSPRDTR